MKFLHTSDWHVGRTVRGQSRLPEHEGVLQEVLAHAREQQVDCVIVAGDIFDASTPAPECESLVYDFFRELFGAGIPAVFIAGNHDHPRRFEALSPLLETLRIRLRGRPRGFDEGGLFEVESSDGRETALIAAAPWLSEREAVDFATLQGDTGAPLVQYAERLAGLLEYLCSSFRPDTVNVLAAHLLIDDSLIGPGGGERELHMAWGVYGLDRQRLPVSAQYTALGHVHKAQSLRASPAAWYSGSLLQLDFGEVNQQKYVNLVEVHPRQPALVSQLPVSRGRRLVDIGAPEQGVPLQALYEHKAEADRAWFRVFLDLDMPVASLPELVRDILPSAVSVERAGHLEAGLAGEVASRRGLGPVELFSRFYASPAGRNHDASPETIALFRRLYEEVQEELSASAQA